MDWEKSPARSSAVGSRNVCCAPPPVAGLNSSRKEEEQLVVAARLAYRTADREPEVLCLRYGLRHAVQLVGLTVGVPIGIAAHVVDRAAEPVRPALGDRHAPAGRCAARIRPGSPDSRTLTSAIDSVFMLNKAAPLLPVSMVETPSITMLLDMHCCVPCACVPSSRRPLAPARRGT